MNHDDYLKYVEAIGIKSIDNRAALARVFDQLRINRRCYSLYGGCYEDAVHLDQLANGEWTVYYVERGITRRDRRFLTESEACEFLLEEVIRDDAVRREAEGPHEQGAEANNDSMSR
jgi:hypothetical protein